MAHSPAGHIIDFEAFLWRNENFLQQMINKTAQRVVQIMYPFLEAQARGDVSAMQTAAAALKPIHDMTIETALGEFLNESVAEELTLQMNIHEPWAQEHAPQLSHLGAAGSYLTYQAQQGQTNQQQAPQPAQPPLMQQGTDQMATGQPQAAPMPQPQKQSRLGGLLSFASGKSTAYQMGSLPTPVAVKIMAGQNKDQGYYSALHGGPPEAAFAVGTYMPLQDLQTKYGANAAGWTETGAVVDSLGNPLTPIGKQALSKSLSFILGG